MTPHEIKTEIFRRRPQGLTVASIGRSLNVSRQTVSLVIEGKGTSRRVAEAVAAAIELPLEVVFPKFAGCQDRRLAVCQAEYQNIN
jgi:orotate phosphoribosyltransferase-like protein